MRLIDANALFDKAFEVWGTEVDGGETNLFMEMINNAPTITQPPNAPLTLEQLREMDGEPVWVTRAGYQSRWALVFVFSKRENIIRLTFDNGNQPIAKTLLDGCKIYRRKPEKKAPREGGTA